MLFFYTIVIHLYKFVLQIGALFYPKARLWTEGRKDIFDKLKQFKRNATTPLAWVHCASLGEFEQGRPVIEGLKKANPSIQIVLTFFSPSGYEIRKNYPLADAVFYMPLDTKSNAFTFVQTLQPNAAIFVKYEFWYYHLLALNQAQVPTFLISSIFTKNQIFFQFYGGLHRQMLGFFTSIFVQTKSSQENLQEINIHNSVVSGDTRIDRVLSIAKESKDIPKAAFFTKEKPTLIGGSTWEKDEDLLVELMNEKPFSNWKFILAPHEIGENRLQQIEKKLPLSSVRYSVATEADLANCRVLIIDNIGLLSSIYKYGKVAYIGGGFGSGIHNTLEPIAFGLPVIFGKKYQKFEEAKYLAQSGGGFVVSNAQELICCIKKLQQEAFYAEASQKAKAYILQNEGCSIGVIKEVLLRMKVSPA